MIQAQELNRESAIKTMADSLISEFELLESKVDKCIRESELMLLNGVEICFTISDSDNKHGSLANLVEKYNQSGWSMKTERSWTANFVYVYLSKYK